MIIRISMRKCIKRTATTTKQEEPEAAFYLKSIIHCKIRRSKIIKKNLSAVDFET